MTTAKDLAQLGKLVAVHHGWAEAKAFKAYELDDAARTAMAKIAVDLLKVFPKVPGAADLLSSGLRFNSDDTCKRPSIW